MLSFEETTEASKPVMAEIAVAMVLSESAEASISISWRVISPVLVFVTLIYISPSVTGGSISARLSLVIFQPVNSVNEPCDPTP